MDYTSALRQWRQLSFTKPLPLFQIKGPSLASFCSQPSSYNIPFSSSLCSTEYINLARVLHSGVHRSFFAKNTFQPSQSPSSIPILATQNSLLQLSHQIFLEHTQDGQGGRSQSQLVSLTQTDLVFYPRLPFSFNSFSTSEQG